MISVFLVIVSIIVGLGRFTVPGHALGFAGSYEALAHIFVGALLVFCFQARTRWVAISCLTAITLLEVGMFMLDKMFH